MSKGATISPEGFAFDIEVLKAEHKEDLTRKYPIGFILHLKNEENKDDGSSVYLEKSKGLVFKVGFTSDTRFYEEMKPYYDCDVVVANISNAAFRELKIKLGFDKFEDEKYLTEDGKKFFDEIRDNSASDMVSVLKWGFWYRDKEGEDGKKNWVDNWLGNEPDCSYPENCKEPVKKEKDCKGCHYAKFPGVLEGHLGASGVYKIWENMKEKVIKEGGEKLLILGEFREEMGSFRNKVAKLLNDEFEKRVKWILSKNDFQDGSVKKLLTGKIIKELNNDHVQLESTIKDEKDLRERLEKINGIDSTEKERVLTIWRQWCSRNIRCFTSDIGMAVRFIEESKKCRSEVQCSVCRHDNDLYDFQRRDNKHEAVAYPKATFHSPNEITEVCIKGDAEGMVYLCEEHDTGPQGLFVEHLERFDLFNSEGVPL